VLELTDLRADCSRCEALCCVLLPYRRDAGFGADKPGGLPCTHLRDDDRCGIHTVLRDRGWASCDVFDCFGAGQWITTSTYAGHSWRDVAADRGEMAAVLSVQRLVHEMLWHLDEVTRRGAADAATRELVDRLLGIRALPPVEMLSLDLDEVLDAASDHFTEVSRRERTGPDLGRPDLAGRDLRGEDLADADLRGALLIGADLRGVRLGRADLLGADLRGARLEGADLGEAWFLTQPQLTAARGDGETVVPPRLRRPDAWSAPHQR